jgi:hypothetical protein
MPSCATPGTTTRLQQHVTPLAACSGSTEFGVVGRYERLQGTVFGGLDPTHLNAGIVNLVRAVHVKPVWSDVALKAGN